MSRWVRTIIPDQVAARARYMAVMHNCSPSEIYAGMLSDWVSQFVDDEDMQRLQAIVRHHKTEFGRRLSSRPKGGS